QARRCPGERGTSAARDADVLRRILGRQSAAVGPVVVGGDLLAELPQPGHRSVFLVGRVDVHGVNARRRVGEIAGLRLPLAEFAPVRAGRIEAAFLGRGRDEDDAGARHRSERLWGALAGHEGTPVYTGDGTPVHPPSPLGASFPG